MKNADDQITDVSLESVWKVNKTKLIDFFLHSHLFEAFLGKCFQFVRIDLIELRGEFEMKFKIRDENSGMFAWITVRNSKSLHTHCILDEMKITARI